KGELYRLAVEVRRRYPEILLIVNDHLDVAMAAGADGVHLGQQDLPVAAARTVAPELIIGASSHSLEQALDAEKAGADYVNIGPIFPTGTKPHSEFLGPETIARISPHLGVQFTVMGGIGPENIEDVLRAGARIVAVVTAVCAAPDPQAAARLLRQKILEFR
ncbi:MAG: thiamine phosphate synthase, partial [Deltaproteobacteria bacterium]